MRDPEHRALLRAAAVLVAISLLRWGVVARGGGAGVRGDGGDRLDAHLTATATALGEKERRSLPLDEGDRIDPNGADEIELDRLPGIGPATARAVVIARDSGVVFRQPEDLLAVRGIGPASLERIRAWITVTRAPADRASRPTGGSRAPGRVGTPPLQPGPRAAIDVNRADAEALQTLPGVGPALATRIIEARADGPFVSVDDLRRVRGIGPATVERLRRFAFAGPRR